MLPRRLSSDCSPVIINAACRHSRQQARHARETQQEQLGADRHVSAGPSVTVDRAARRRRDSPPRHCLRLQQAPCIATWISRSSCRMTRTRLRHRRASTSACRATRISSTTAVVKEVSHLLHHPFLFSASELSSLPPHMSHSSATSGAAASSAASAPIDLSFREQVGGVGRRGGGREVSAEEEAQGVEEGGRQLVPARWCLQYAGADGPGEMVACDNAEVCVCAVAGRKTEP